MFYLLLFGGIALIYYLFRLAGWRPRAGGIEHATSYEAPPANEGPVFVVRREPIPPANAEIMGLPVTAVDSGPTWQKALVAVYLGIIGAVLVFNSGPIFDGNVWGLIATLAVYLLVVCLLVVAMLYPRHIEVDGYGVIIYRFRRPDRVFPWSDILSVGYSEQEEELLYRRDSWFDNRRYRFGIVTRLQLYTVNKTYTLFRMERGPDEKPQADMIRQVIERVLAYYKSHDTNPQESALPAPDIGI